MSDLGSNADYFALQCQNPQTVVCVAHYGATDQPFTNHKPVLHCQHERIQSAHHMVISSPANLGKVAADVVHAYS